MFTRLSVRSQLLVMLTFAAVFFLLLHNFVVNVQRGDIELEVLVTPAARRGTLQDKRERNLTTTIITAAAAGSSVGGLAKGNNTMKSSTLSKGVTMSSIKLVTANNSTAKPAQKSP